MSSTIQDGGPAFPRIEIQSNGARVSLDGMSLRDYFAAAALTGMSVRSLHGEERIVGADGRDIGPMLKALVDEQTIAHWCYQLADAMLAAREKAWS